MKINANTKVKTSEDIYRLIFPRVIIVSVFATICMTLRVLLFHDVQSGLLKVDPISTLLLALSIFSIIYMIVMALLFSRKLGDVEESTAFLPSRIKGISFLSVSIFFIAQFAIDLSDIIFYVVRVADGTYAKVQLPSLLSWLCCILSLLSAASYLAQGYLVAKKGQSPTFLLTLIPIAWCVLTLLNVMMTYPTTVSLQPDAEKVILCSFTLLFVYYLSGRSSGMAERKQARISLLIRIQFPAIGLAFSLPYGIALICGIHDRIATVPYVAIIGLSIMALILSFYPKRCDVNGQIVDGV